MKSVVGRKGLEDSHFAKFMRPQGAPRGLLAYYVLYTLSKKPAHGYEILQDIESKTEGAWRPGAGSIYPILKKFSDEDFIKSEQSKSSKLPTAQRTYEITQKGEKCLQQWTQRFTEAGKHWGSLRRIFMGFIKPQDLSKFLIDGTRLQFEMWQETFESKISQLSQNEAGYILKEYALMLERQMDWVNRKSKEKKMISEELEIKKRSK